MTSDLRQPAPTRAADLPAGNPFLLGAFAPVADETSTDKLCCIRERHFS